jgi:hypothetical protein
MHDYQILQDLLLYRLEQKVNEHLSKGYILIGGPLTHTEQYTILNEIKSRPLFLQAVAKPTVP